LVSSRRKAAAKTWEKRTQLVKTQTTAESAYNDAKTIRLKALRLEKEAQDAEDARVAAENAPPAPVKKPRAKRSV
jgi:hypothetical protein